ncbi:MAG TPA: hypothetical protein VMA95_13950 [Streptosporangiaceae bacterium]|nr:hypothetical protein [Streptosporangiaceae bacterium]
MDSQLRNLLVIAAGEPPHRVTIDRVRRTLIRRRFTTAASAALAVILAGGTGVAVSAVVTGQPPAGSLNPAGRPPFYYQLGKGHLIRSTASGAITGHVVCPWRGAALNSATVARPSTFFISCGKLVRTGQTSQAFISQIYRFTLTSKGRITGYTQVRGGTLTNLEVYQMAASPDGSELAFGVGGIGGPPYEVIVLNTLNGSQTSWSQVTGRRSQYSYLIDDLSFTSSGRKLVFLVSVACDSHFSACKSPGNEVRELNPAGPGTLVGRTTLLFKRAALTAHEDSVIEAAQVSPDGKVVTLVLVTNTQRSGLPGSISVLRVAARSGKVLEAIYRSQRADSYVSFRFFSADISRRYFLLGYEYGGTLRSYPLASGWLDKGKLMPLPHAGRNADSEIW